MEPAGITLQMLAADGTPALAQAAAKGNTAKVSGLLASNSASINDEDPLGMTALHYAALYGHADTAEALLLEGANVKARNALGATPLHLAAFRLDESSAAAHLGILRKRNESMRPHYTFAKADGHAGVVKVLLSAGAPVDAADARGRTSLMAAAASGHMEAMIPLLRAQADVAATDVNGATGVWRTGAVSQRGMKILSEPYCLVCHDCSCMRRIKNPEAFSHNSQPHTSHRP